MQQRKSPAAAKAGKLWDAGPVYASPSSAAAAKAV